MHIENYSEGVYVCNSYYLFLKKKIYLCFYCISQFNLK